MSSCFLCDCTYVLTDDNKHTVIISGTSYGDSLDVVYMYMKQVPIMFGSPGNQTNDRQHIGMTGTNYLSYRVKKIDFCCSIQYFADSPERFKFPGYILIFKVPLRDPIVNYNFQTLDKFMLYSEPESVLGYKVLYSTNLFTLRGQPATVKIEINKPFILGPRDYVGVFYMVHDLGFKFDASAKVWFDIA